MTQQEASFIQAAAPAAQLSAKQYGVPASITIAQAILESEWGKSGLATEANNYFGVKAIQGEDYVEFKTTEFVRGVATHPMADFAKYASVADSFAAHAKLLSGLPRYAAAMKVAKSPALFAQAIKACGYSTAPNYPQMLMQLVQEFDLGKFDVAPVGAVSATQAKT